MSKTIIKTPIERGIIQPITTKTIIDSIESILDKHKITDYEYLTKTIEILIPFEYSVIKQLIYEVNSHYKMNKWVCLTFEESIDNNKQTKVLLKF